MISFEEESGAGLEALLVQRSKAVKHMGGMWVFPGGKADEADYSSDRDAYSAAVNAAIRETEEEAGLTFPLTSLSTCRTGRRQRGQRNVSPPGFF